MKKFLLVTVVLLSFCALFVSCNSDVTSNYRDTKEYVGPKVDLEYDYETTMDGVRYLLDFGFTNNSLGYTEADKDRQVALYVWVKDIHTNEWPTYPICYFGHVDSYYYYKILSDTSEEYITQRDTQTLVFNFQMVRIATEVNNAGFPIAFGNADEIYTSTIDQYDGVADAGSTSNVESYEYAISFTYASYTKPFAVCENPSFANYANSVLVGPESWTSFYEY